MRAVRAVRTELKLRVARNSPTFVCIFFFTVFYVFQLSEDRTLFKLGDFGLARATEGTRQTKTMIGSYRYMAPEVVKSGGRYSNKADVHSFGEGSLDRFL